MSDKMQPIPFRQMVNWILAEYNHQKTIFGIPSSKFYSAKNNNDDKLFGESLDAPVGPAAGPHTQLCQNLVSAYLTGGRFFELKTVQKLDNLEIDKPCINANDEGYNVEWSQELALDDSYAEYVKAWILMHFLKNVFDLSGLERGFLFNMSVGYDLEGIKSEKMGRFIEELKNATNNPVFNSCKSILSGLLKDKLIIELMEKSFGISGDKLKEIAEKIENISPFISSSVTLSTMHGCPPEDIEAIVKHLIQQKNLHTYVKLNPTLLGYDFVSSTLNKLGYKYIQLDRSSFDHDLQYRDAIPMLNRLRSFASAHNRVFGIKLSNTLGVKNTNNVMPGDDMYMSGRALFPLTINLAYKLASEFNGGINISYSGGANNNNIQEIIQTGITPITFATDLLKPGGYLRLLQIAETAEKNYVKNKRGDKINLAVLNTLAEVSLSERNYSKEKREIKSIKIQKSLPHFDCFIAPCQEACPIHQDVASYIKLVEQKRYDEAYELIVSKNPLPHITGYICDHQCMYHCTRWDYDDPVLIRDLKKEAAENGYRTYLTRFNFDFLKIQNNIKVAVIGAGPSGLSAAYFLAKAGFDVTIFEREMNAGGIVQNILPKFRLPKEAIEKDIEFIEKHGIKFIFGIDPDFSTDQLKKEGFKYIYVAIGADASNKIDLENDSELIFDAIDFLRDFHKNKKYKIGMSVAVVGGGNSAMDSARAAKRYAGVENVYLLYRRSKDEMPADMEEFYAALKDGVDFRELLLPVKFFKGVLTCQKMNLGDIGPDGRKKVLPVENEFVELAIDSVISAIGEHVDTEFLIKNKIAIENNKVIVTAGNETQQQNVFIGGDALRGPSTVVESIADGKIAADAIISKENIEDLSKKDFNNFSFDQKFFNEYIGTKGKISGQIHANLNEEAGRCLGCNYICNKCVEVCPNRANIEIKSDSTIFKDKNQIVHLDALCNECGNCETFCPYQGAPYKEKLTLFWNEKEFFNSGNDGFYFSENGTGSEIEIRVNKKLGKIILDERWELVNSFTIEDQEKLGKMISVIKEIKKNYQFLLVN